MQQPESSTSNDIAFPDQQKYLATIAQTADSQPTKAKVTAFKTRVYKLIRLYAEKCANLGPLVASLRQEFFMRDPDRMNQIVVLVLNREGNLGGQDLGALLDIYKLILLYKNKPQINNKLTQTFTKILKKVISNPESQSGVQVLKQMLHTVFFKRNCKLNVVFFQLLIRKLPATRKIIIEACNKLKNDEGPKMRPAQRKQLDKLIGRINKKGAVKVKTEVDLDADDDHDQQPNKKSKKGKNDKSKSQVKAQNKNLDKTKKIKKQKKTIIKRQEK